MKIVERTEGAPPPTHQTSDAVLHALDVVMALTAREYAQLCWYIDGLLDPKSWQDEDDA